MPDGWLWLPGYCCQRALLSCYGAAGRKGRCGSKVGRNRMELESWLELGVVLGILVGAYLLVRRPLQRKRLFDLSARKLKHRRNGHPRR